MPTKKKTNEEKILEHISPNELLEIARQSIIEDGQDLELYIGDTVQLITDTKGDKVYTIYSFTTYADGRINFTLWNGSEYEMYEPWQIKKFYPVEPIGFKHK